MSEQLYKCPECGLHYQDKDIALDCEKFCRENHACNLEVTKYAVEVEQRQDNES